MGDFLALIARGVAVTILPDHVFNAMSYAVILTFKKGISMFESIGFIGAGRGARIFLGAWGPMLVYPIDENHAVYWGDDPWTLASERDGTRLRDPVSYLVAYYMGRVHGFIAE